MRWNLKRKPSKMYWNFKRHQQCCPFSIASSVWGQTCKMRRSRIIHEHVARRKFSLWLQQGCIVTIYLHSVTLARVMSQTYGSTYLTSVCHRSLLLWTARERPATQRPRACKSQLSISATKALIINLSYFLPTSNALQYRLGNINILPLYVAAATRPSKWSLRISPSSSPTWVQIQNP